MYETAGIKIWKMDSSRAERRHRRGSSSWVRREKWLLGSMKELGGWAEGGVRGGEVVELGLLVVVVVDEE